MREWNLQIILDKGILENRDVLEIANSIIEGGAACIQLRDKISSDRTFFEEAKALRGITKEKGCTFIINDRVDIAMACDADGVHLGQDDLALKDARNLIGPDKLIGLSTHNIEQAKEAQMMGADYIGVGPIFPTRTKPALKALGLDIVSSVSKRIEIPTLFIGGINLENLNRIIERGARAIAVASAILNSEDIAKTTRSFIDILENEKLKT